MLITLVQQKQVIVCGIFLDLPFFLGAAIRPRCVGRRSFAQSVAMESHILAISGSHNKASAFAFIKL